MLPSSDPIKGQEIDGYRILDILGRGGMGIVYKAEDVALLRPVALKMIDPSLAQDEAFLRRFRSEARALARIDNPNIVRVYALRQNERGVFIVMEYVEGGTLSDLITSDPLPWPRAMPIIKQMLHAFAHAHELGIIHRDIKPSNIMLTPDHTVKVTDFGLAKMQRTDGTITLTKGVTGTLFFMSPEQVKGNVDLDHRTDLYSLGMTIYKTLAGRLPFDRNEGEFAIMRRIVEERFPPPNTFNPDVPKRLAAIVMKSLEKEPAKRYADAQKMLKAFEAFESVMASPHMPDEKTITASHFHGTALPDIEGVVTPPRDEATIVLPHVTEETIASESKSLASQTSTLTRRPVIQKRSPAKHRQSITYVIAAIVVLCCIGGYYLYTSFANDGAFESAMPAVNQSALSITTEPPGATVLFDGVEMQIHTPIDAYMIDEGDVRLAIRMEGYTTVDTTVTASDGLPVFLNISLPELRNDLLAQEESEPQPSEMELEAPAQSAVDRSIVDEGRPAQPEETPEQITPLQKGGLIINSEPSEAEVWVGDELLGTTPFSTNEWAVGNYPFVLRKSGYEAFEGNITIRAGLVESSLAKLVPLPRGTLEAMVLPFGSIYIDDVLKSGSTNAPYIERLLPGTYLVRATHANYGVWEKEVRIDGNDEHRIVFNFTEQVEITVTSEPSMAEIFVDGKATGSWTPSMIVVNPGQRTIEVKKTGYSMQDGIKIIALEGNLLEPIHFKLVTEQ